MAEIGQLPMQDREKHSPLDSELEMPPGQKLAQHLLTAGLLPQSLEN